MSFTTIVISAKKGPDENPNDLGNVAIVLLWIIHFGVIRKMIYYYFCIFSCPYM